jgi:hypothetical protein
MTPWHAKAISRLAAVPEPQRSALREFYEECAARREYDAGFSRDEAERLAYGEMVRKLEQ